MAVTWPLSAATNITATGNDIRVAHSLLNVEMFHFLIPWNLFRTIYKSLQYKQMNSFTMFISLLLSPYMFRLNYHHQGTNTYIIKTYSNKIFLKRLCISDYS